MNLTEVESDLRAGVVRSEQLDHLGIADRNEIPSTDAAASSNVESIEHVFAIRPSERRPSLMRPLSLAGICAAVCSLLLGLANGLQAVARSDAVEPTSLRFGALVAI